LVESPQRLINGDAAREQPLGDGDVLALRVPAAVSRRGALWFALPALVLYALIVLYTTLAGATSAFTDWDSGERRWVALANFDWALGDDAARAALCNAVTLALFFVIVETALVLVLALGLEAVSRGRRWLAALLAPAIISPLVAAVAAFAPRGHTSSLRAALGDHRLRD